MSSIARIALNRPLRRLFDYSIPDGLNLVPGQRVLIPFGRQRAIGLVVETGVQSESESSAKGYPVTVDFSRGARARSTVSDSQSQYPVRVYIGA